MTAILDNQAADTRALVDAAKTGDRDAFGQLYTRYRLMVYRYISYRIPNRHTAEDLTQDVFRRALTALTGYQHQGSDIGAWLNTIARNIVIDHTKSYNARLVFPVDASESFAGHVDDSPGPDARAASAIQRAALAGAIARLTGDQRTCIELRLRGLSVAETAAALGRNDGAVKALQARATANLRRDPALEALR